MGMEGVGKLHLQLRPKKDKEVVQSIGRKAVGGKEEIGMIPKATFKEEWFQKENP